MSHCHTLPVLVLSLFLTPTWVGCAAAPEAPPADTRVSITFPPRPRLVYSAAELALLKQDPAQAGPRAALAKRGDAILARGLQLPEKSGQWYFYYACAKEGAHLNAESADRHVCPSCKAVYTDERTCAAYRTILHDQFNSECLALAVAGAVTADPKYATPVVTHLLKLAALYPTWTKHDRWGRTGLLAVVGGRRYCQLLDEATSTIKLARAYDLVAGTLTISEADRKTIEDGLFRYVTDDLRGGSWFVGVRNNHQTWFNAACATAAVAIGDADLLQAALWGKASLQWQLENSVTGDGIWYEGTMSYHFYALAAIQDTLDAARRVGITMKDHARLQSLWLGPLGMAWPDGALPALNDGDPASLGGYRGFFDWAANYFGDPRFALPAADAKDTGTRLTSTILKDFGIAVLRRGTRASAAAAMVDYGIHGDHHGHPDKLNLLLYAHGRELLLDPGRITYSVPEYESWCRTTVAHNTLVVNGENQRPTTGALWFFEDTPDRTACLTASADAYPGWDLRRFVLLTDCFALDVFSASGPAPAQLDLATHCREAQPAPALQLTPVPDLGKGAGYKHLLGGRRITGKPGAGPLWTATVGKATPDTAAPRLNIHVADLGTPDLYVGTGIGVRLDEKVPFLIRRVTAKTAVFVTVYDWTPGDGQVTAAAVANPSAGKDAVPGLKVSVSKAGRTQTFTLYLQPPPAKAGIEGAATTPAPRIVAE